MQHPVYLEDYIVALCDLSDIATPGITAKNMIRLSKQYRTPIRGIAQQVQVKRLGLTKHQVDLIHILAKKYRKQLARWNIDTDLAVSAPALLPLREVEQYRILDLQNDRLRLRFNYNKDLIKQLHAYTLHQGQFEWCGGDAAWLIYPSEANVKYAVEFAANNKFVIVDAVLSLHRDLLDFESQHSILDFTPTLNADGSVSNASDELVEYMAQKQYSFFEACNTSWANGYMISQSARDRLRSELQQFGSNAHDLLQLITNRYTETICDNFLEVAKQYCALTNSGPIVLIVKGPLDIEPTTIAKLRKRHHAPGKDEIIFLDANETKWEDLEKFTSVVTGRTVLPDHNALVISDVGSGYWYWFNLTLNKIWNLKKPNES